MNEATEEQGWLEIIEVGGRKEHWASQRKKLGDPVKYENQAIPGNPHQKKSLKKKQRPQRN